MGLQITPISFSASTVIKSTDMNTNWTSVQTASNFDGVWNSASNSSAQLTVEDATIGSINIVRVRPATGSVDRGAALADAVSGVASSTLYVDSTGATNIGGNVGSIYNDVHNLYYQHSGFFIATGPGTYTTGITSGASAIAFVFTQKNTATKSVSTSSPSQTFTITVATSDAGTQWFFMSA